jgi:hypothetical protein
MDTSLLDDSDHLGFCTPIETTKSRLFVRGCSRSSDSLGNDDFWFSASVPAANSSESEQMLRLIGDYGSGRIPGAVALSPILIQVVRTEEVARWTAEQQARFASRLVNRFLRAYEHTYFDVSVPRHRLDGRPIVMISADSLTRLNYTPVMLDLDDALGYYLPSHVDVEQPHLEVLMGSPEVITPSWSILLDGARHFENGNLREAVVCACSAAEIIASPVVESWLDRHTLGAHGEDVRTAVREMGNPLRFDLCVSGACSNAFEDVAKEDRANLLGELKRMNSLRNSVVHRGAEPEAAATAMALRAAATFICKMWIASLESRE